MFQVRTLKSERLNHTSKVTKLPSDQEPEPGFKPRKVWFQRLAPSFHLSYFSDEEGPRNCTYHVPFKPKAIQLLRALVHKFWFLVERM